LIIYLTVALLGIFFVVTTALKKVGLPDYVAWIASSSVNFGGQICVCFFTTLSIVTITPFICPRHPNGRRSVSTYPEVFCETDEHSSMVIGGVVSLLFLFGFYAIVCTACWKAPALVYTMKKETFEQTFRFMFNKFNMGRWYWLCILLPRGVCMSLTPVVAPDDARAQMLLLSIVLGTYSAVTALLKPWRVPIMCTLDCVIMVTLVGVLFASSAFVRIDFEADEVYDGTAIAGITFIFVTCFLMLLMSTVNMLLEGQEGKMHAYLLGRRTSPNFSNLVKELTTTMGNFSKAHKQKGTELEGILDAWDVNDVISLTDTFVMLSSYGMLPDKGHVYSRLSIHRHGGDLDKACDSNAQTIGAAAAAVPTEDTTL